MTDKTPSELQATVARPRVLTQDDRDVSGTQQQAETILGREIERRGTRADSASRRQAGRLRGFGTKDAETW